jgi:nitrogen fixation protein FixH
MSHGLTSAREAAPERVFTGRAFLLCLVVGFGVVFAVNFTMAYLAIKTFAGVDTPSSYQAGQVFSKTLAAAAAQVARGWKVTVGVERAPGATQSAAVTAAFDDRDGKPLPGLVVKARLEHPSNEFLDREAILIETDAGRFAGAVEGVTEGGWTLVISGARDGQTLFASRNRVALGP